MLESVMDMPKLFKYLGPNEGKSRGETCMLEREMAKSKLTKRGTRIRIYWERNVCGLWGRTVR